METISNVVNTVSTTATKAIWGEKNETAGTEPASGVQGKGTATEPYDGGNSEDPTAPTTHSETADKESTSALESGANTTSLPIREKSSTTETSDLAAANEPTLAVRPDETNTAGVAGTANLSETLSKTGDVAEKDVVPAGKDQPALAGFAENRTIDPEDKSQIPTEVSDSTTTKSAAPATGATTGLSEDIAKANLPVASPVTSPSGTAAPTASTKTPAEGAKETDRIVEGKSEEKEKPVAAKEKAASPTGEKEKVSKMEKLKEKLHIGHKH